MILFYFIKTQKHCTALPTQFVLDKLVTEKNTNGGIEERTCVCVYVGSEMLHNFYYQMIITRLEIISQI